MLAVMPGELMRTTFAQDIKVITLQAECRAKRPALNHIEYQEYGKILLVFDFQMIETMHVRSQNLDTI